MPAKKKAKSGSAKVPLPETPVEARLVTLVAPGTGHLPGNIVRFGPVGALDRVALHVLTVKPGSGAILLWSLASRGEFAKIPRLPLQQTASDGPGVDAGVTCVWQHHAP
jgi:hypothetical protein